MKNLLKISGIIGLVLVIVLLSTGCKTVDDRISDEFKLDIPANVIIEVNVRQMTVTWNAVNNALGYEIYTTSENCGSGNRIINTRENTATSHTGTPASTDPTANGAVQFKGATTIEITLMPEVGSTTEPMPTAVTAKVKALGGKTGGQEFLDSEYSAVTTLNKDDYN